jgi:hypothetical protein
MKKNSILITFLCVSLLIGLAGCGSTKLAEGFVEEDLRQAAENVITLINQADAEGIRENGIPQLQTALTDEVMTQIFADISSAGQFEKIEDMSVAGVKGPDGKADFAVVVAKAKYASKSLIYTISFNDAMELAGLYYK